MQKNDGSQKISGDALKDLYKSFVSEYPIESIEDPFDQDDWEHYSKLTNEIGTKVQIVGDDLLVTNPKVEFHLSAGVFYGKSCMHPQVLFFSKDLDVTHSSLISAEG